MANPLFHTVAEVQAQLRLAKPDAVLAAIRLGELRAVNVSAGPTRPTWRIPAAALEDWLTSRTATPPATAQRRPRAKAKSGVTAYF